MAFFTVVELFEHHHRNENIMFFEFEQRGRIVHQDVGIQDVNALASGHAGFLAWGRGQYFIGSMMASRLRWSQNSMNSSRNAAMCMLAGMPTVSCAVNIEAPVCMA